MNAESFIQHVLAKATSFANPNKKTAASNAKVLTPKILSLLRSGRVLTAVRIICSSSFAFDPSLYATIFNECGNHKAIVEARRVEAHLHSFVADPPTFLLNRAIETYGKCGCVADARGLFDEMPSRDGGSWNALITAYSKNGRAEEAFHLFHDMHKSGVVSPSEVTLSSVLGSCGSVLELCLARQVHGLIVKYGFIGNVILESSMVDVYGKCGEMDEARRMFDEVKEPNSISWNIIIRRYLDMNLGEQAVLMFSKMVTMKVNPLNFTVSNALIACSTMRGLREGVQIHGYAVKINLEDDEVVTTSLINMYGKCKDVASASMIFDRLSTNDLISYTSMFWGFATNGKIREARELFDQMPERNTVSWNAMLSAYTTSGQWDEALDFFFLMLKEGISIDHVTLALILKVCSGLSDIQLGKQIHGYIYRHAFYHNVIVGNAVLDMYGKCGNLKQARAWFSEMVHVRDTVSWTSLLASYARRQMSEQSMDMVGEMLEEAIPSNFTFPSLLAAWANIFALEPGKQIHGYMIRNNYEMCTVTSAALVDFYSKCRRIDYAIRVFKRSDLSDVIIWNSMMLGCYYNGKCKGALELFELMERKGLKPDHVTFHGLLLSCVSESCIELGRQYFDSMSEKYCIIPRLEHYQSMIELYGRHGCMEQLEHFIKTIPFQLTSQMLVRVFDFCRKQKHLQLGEWVTDQLNRLNPEKQLKFDIGRS
ncbi:OLC1v1008099C1 [Oldenlandia corymbosa var. corymbosa]|uniref:OLC1v1008099C1 n=1 Tax=Oldenlandia corymbosa var. corymbosa TaxID=529605 RepID=A0AAV1DKT8_OLDCO|nr:OLC1v1008099C1 [Oldenlandia corymbosa var. corymbosa]